MVNRNLRISAPEQVAPMHFSGAPPSRIVDTSLLTHLRHQGLSKVALQCVPLLLGLGCIYLAYSLLSQSRWSYLFTLFLFGICSLSALALRGDKLCAPIALLAGIIGLVSERLG